MADYKKIAKNSLLLYMRTIITILISIYTSRVILDILGVTDYGIYNVVGGIVVVLGALNGSLAGASTRFITYSSGRYDIKKVSSTFVTLNRIHTIISVIFFIVVEPIGTWYIYTKLNIPRESITGAFWIFQFSVVTSIVSLISVPYNSLIIAYEKMDTFAYVSIIESILKLTAVYALLLFNEKNRLVIYGLLICTIQISIRIYYGIYCRKTFKLDCSSKTDKNVLREIFKFVGWKFNGDLAFIGCSQGLNLVLNLFFGPVVNAARGIAQQVQNFGTIFVQNYQMAIQPQIIKSYASDNISETETLIHMSSKIGFFFILIIAVPILIFTQEILSLWLVDVPEYSVFLVRISLIVCMIYTLRNPLIQAINATGDIKKFQIYEGTCLLLVVPMCYLGLKCFDFTLQFAMITYLLIEIFAQLIRVWIVFPICRMKYSNYIRRVILPIFKVGIFVCPVVLIPKIKLSLYEMLGCIMVIDLYILIICFFIGLNRMERHKIIYMINSKIKL